MTDISRTNTPPLVPRTNQVSLASPDRNRDRAPLRSRPSRSASDTPQFESQRSSNPRRHRVPPPRREPPMRPLPTHSIAAHDSDADDELDSPKAQIRSDAPHSNMQQTLLEVRSRGSMGPFDPAFVMEQKAQFAPHSAPSRIDVLSAARRRSISPQTSARAQTIFPKPALRPILESSQELISQLSESSTCYDTSSSGATTDAGIEPGPLQQPRFTLSDSELSSDDFSRRSNINRGIKSVA